MHRLEWKVLYKIDILCICSNGLLHDLRQKLLGALLITKSLLRQPLTMTKPSRNTRTKSLHATDFYLCHSSMPCWTTLPARPADGGLA